MSRTQVFFFLLQKVSGGPLYIVLENDLWGQTTVSRHLLFASSRKKKN